MIDEIGFKAIFQASATPSLICLPDAPVYTVAEVNQAYVELTGISAKGLIGKGFLQAFNGAVSGFSSARLTQLADSLDTARLSGQADQLRRLPGAFACTGGAQRYYDVENIPVAANNEQPACILHTLRDVTIEVSAELERKETLKALAAEHVRYASLFNHNPDAVFSLDPAGRFTSTNERLLKMVECAEKDILSLTFDPFIAPEYMRQVRHHFEEALKGKAQNYDTEIVTTTGKRLFVNATKLPIVIENEIVGIYCIAKDITERQLLKEKLVKEKQLSDSLISNLPSSFFLFTADGRFLRWNKYVEDISGYEPEEIGNMHPQDFFPDDVKPLVKEKIDIGFRDGKTEMEAPLLSKSGKTNPFYITACRIQYEGRTCLVGTGLDLSQKIYDEKLIEEKNLLISQSQQIAKMGYWQWNLASNEVTWSDELYTIYGIDKSDFAATFEGYLALLHPDDQERVKRTIQGAVENKSNVTFEERIVRQDNKIRYLKSWGAVIADDKGDPVKMIGACLDITDSKEAEEAVRISNERYEFVTEATFAAIWDWNLQTNSVHWGSGFNTTFGYGADEMISTADLWSENIHPDDKQRVLESTKTAVEGTGKTWAAEYRYRKANGEFVHVIDKGIIIRDDRGKAIRMTGALQDVTLQKTEETRLKLLESVITHTNDAVLITEAEPRDAAGHRIVYVNEAFTRMTGYTAAEIVGKTPKILQGPKSDKAELANLSRALKNWQPCEITTVNYKKSGEEFWINFSVSPVMDERGWYSHWIALEKDVTQRKNEELQKTLLNEISQIFNREFFLKPTLENVLKHLASYEACDLTEIWLTSSDNQHLKLIASVPADAVSDQLLAQNNSVRVLAFGEGLPGVVWKNKTVGLWQNVAAHKHFARKQLAEKLLLTTVMGVPILHHQQVLGVLVLGAKQKNAGKLVHYESFFKELAAALGLEIKRKQLEEELLQLFETSPDILCIAGMDGKFIKVNPAFCKLLGFTSEELTTQPFSNFIHPADLEASQHEYLQTLQVGKTAHGFVNRYVTKEGKYRWISWNSSQLTGDEGVSFVYGRDITEEKELEDLLDNATQMARIGSWEVDLTRQRLYWSDMTKEIHETGPDFEPTLEKAIEFYKDGDDRNQIGEAVRLAIEQNLPWDKELRIITAKGNLRWVRTIGRAEHVNNKCVKLYGSIQDIDKQKKAEIAIKEAFDEKSTILESIGDAFFAVDTTWVVTYWNSKAETVLGKAKADIVGKNLWEVYSDAKGLKFFSQYHRAMETGEIVQFEEHYPTTNQWFEVKAYPSKQGLSVYFIDVSIRKIAEEQVRQSNERFEKVAEATNDAIWDWDITNNFLYRGSGFHKIFGYHVNRKLETENFWTDRFHPDDLLLIKESLEKVITDKKATNWVQEYRILRADGKTATVIDRGVVIRDKQGNAIRMVGAISDITHRKEYEESLKDLNQKLRKHTLDLEHSNKELEQFAYIASHDLQEPLRMITGFLTQLEKNYQEQLDEKARKYIYFATDGARRMRQIILDLLEFSRVGRREEGAESVDVNEVLEETHALLRNKIEETGAHIAWEKMPVLHIARTPLSQLFQNLISNGLKYQAEGNKPVVQISVEEKAACWRFAIKDNGIGIPTAYFDKIFIIFQRLHARDEYSGTGMGLAICKKIIEHMGGEIWLESEEGNGSTFYFTIPKKPTP